MALGARPGAYGIKPQRRRAHRERRRRTAVQIGWERCGTADEPGRTPRARAARRGRGDRRFILSEVSRKVMLICRALPAEQRFNILLSLCSFPGAFWLLSRWELVVARFDCYLASFGYVSAPWAALKILSWSGWLFARLLKFCHFGLPPRNKLTLR